jgi:hypothetical protein
MAGSWLRAAHRRCLEVHGVRHEGPADVRVDPSHSAESRTRIVPSNDDAPGARVEGPARTAEEAEPWHGWPSSCSSGW